MQLHLGLRHFLSNASGLGILESRIEDLHGIPKNPQLQLSIDISISPFLDPDSVEKGKEAMLQARSCGIHVKYHTNRPVGMKVVGQLFQEPKTIHDIFGICDLDQFPLTGGRYEAAMEIGEQMIQDKKAFSSGSRNVPVRLGVSEEANTTRIIQELIHAAAGQYRFHTEKPSWAQASPCYEAIGETTSGFYLINPQGEGYELLRKEVLSLERLWTTPGFSIEYFLAIKAGILDTVSPGYVHAEENTFPEIHSEQELANSHTRIDTVTKDLRSTSVSAALLDVLCHPDKLSPIEEFFPGVEYVANRMREQFKI